MERLLLYKAICNTTDKFGNTLLHAMVSYNSCEGVDMLLQYGAEVNAVNNEGCTTSSLISV
jgi:ankyrin repeat protein